MLRRLLCLVAVSLAAAPALMLAQNPLADAFRANAAAEAKNLIAAAEEMPADKYDYKPTPAQMSFGQIVAHLSGGNDALCGTLTGTKPPARTKISATDSKDVLVARLKETFDFCHSALANLTDAGLGRDVSVFGGKFTLARLELVTVGDWADHYSQVSNYLRINGLLPPTAKAASQK
jgi:hypothetical protein